MKDELEMAMKLLEKDIYTKQDGLVTLREQLDNVKAINIDIHKKLLVSYFSHNSRLLYSSWYFAVSTWIYNLHSTRNRFFLLS